MGEYYTLENHTIKEKAFIGKFYEWEYHLKNLKWSNTDNVIAYGDYGSVLFLNKTAPEYIVDFNSEKVWEMCKYASLRLNITPEEFYKKFIEQTNN